MDLGGYAGHLLVALDTASPTAVDDVVDRFLTEKLGATATKLRLIDYQQTALHPLNGGDDPRWVGVDAGPMTVEGSAAGWAFTRQAALTIESDAGHVIYLPVARRSDCLGVLAVALPTVPDEAMIAELGRIATVIGYALDVAGRRTDRFERARRTRPFSVAAEVQWHQLPARACATPRYQLAGDLEPAYEVGGDSFDWAVGADALTVVVTDAMGHALPAAMLSTLALAGLRQGRRAGMGLSGQARVADRALLERYAGEQFVTATLLQLDLCSGETRMVQAGSPDIYHLHDGKVRLVDTQSQLPLGMAEATDYQERFIDLIPGDRLVLVTDGVTEARNSSGEEFGDTRLADAITSTSDQRPVEAVPLIYRGLRAFSGGQPLRDDATVLCLDWLGPNPNL